MPERERDEEHPRIAQMREFCERQGWTFRAWTGTQREPGDGVSITLGEPNSKALGLRAVSYDSQMVAVAKMETALATLVKAQGDAYLQDRHRDWGRV